MTRHDSCHLLAAWVNERIRRLMDHRAVPADRVDRLRTRGPPALGGLRREGCVMNAISKFAAGLLVAVAAVPALAGNAPYESACTKALHPGKPHPYATRSMQPYVYARPTIAAQPRVTVAPAPQVATAPAGDQGRRTFSYEPAAPTMAAPVMAAPRYVAPSYRAVPQAHTWENATMKGLGQIR